MSRINAAPQTGDANLAFARALIGAMHGAGLQQAVICPGSRSTPLALAVMEHPGLAHCVHIDERSAGFYALGHAKASGRPVALLCTSGTAAAGFLPAVAEAWHARVPLLVLSADRPPELRAWGAAQTMEQRRLYDGFLRWFEEAPCPGETSAGSGYAVLLGRRAVAEATGPAAGPVHLNLPFREPLAPDRYQPPAPAEAMDGPLVVSPVAAADGFGDLAAQLRGEARGVLLLGPERAGPDLADRVGELAGALGWPVIADPASGLRAAGLPGEQLIDAADLLLSDAEVAATLRPDLIIRFGSVPTSAAVAAWMARHREARLWLVDPAAALRDPQHRAERVFRSSAATFCRLACDARQPSATATGSWNAAWQRANEAARAAATLALDAEPRLLSPQVARLVWEQLPADALLYVGNSMAIRDFDSFAGRRATMLTLLANRGINGIDGLVSAALGAAAASGQPTVLCCGDLALLHDVSGLLSAAMLDSDLTIVVSNDRGGGIFEYLAVADRLPRELFERGFAVSHDADLCAIARGFGFTAQRVDSLAALGDALAQALAAKGRHLLEVRVDRQANTEFHRRIRKAAAAAARQALLT